MLKSKKEKEPAAAAPAEPARKAAPAAKRAAVKAPAQKVEELYLQFGGQEWNVSECRERATAAFVAAGHRASTIKKLAIYLKPEEGKAYYVVNDKENGSIDL